MTRRALLVASAAGLAAPATAQMPSFTSDTTISMPLFWSEINGNDNGILEPGESAGIVMNVSFSNQFGVAHFAPPIGTFTSGTILGLGLGFLDVLGSGGTEGAFNIRSPLNNGASGYGVRSGWRVVGSASHGSVNATGTGIASVQFGWFPIEYPETTNPIPRLYAFLWTPASYAARTVTFTAAGASAAPTNQFAGVVLDFDGNVIATVLVPPTALQLGAVSIPIIPASFTFLPFATFAWCIHRRRRPNDAGAAP